jgi:hypothetical protein
MQKRLTSFNTILYIFNIKYLIINNLIAYLGQKVLTMKIATIFMEKARVRHRFGQPRILALFRGNATISPRLCFAEVGSPL